MLSRVLGIVLGVLAVAGTSSVVIMVVVIIYCKMRQYNYYSTVIPLFDCILMMNDIPRNAIKTVIPYIIIYFQSRASIRIWRGWE